MLRIHRKDTAPRGRLQPAMSGDWEIYSTADRIDLGTVQEARSTLKMFNPKYARNWHDGLRFVSYFENRTWFQIREEFGWCCRRGDAESRYPVFEQREGIGGDSRIEALRKRTQTVL